VSPSPLHCKFPFRLPAQRLQSQHHGSAATFRVSNFIFSLSICSYVGLVILSFLYARSPALSLPQIHARPITRHSAKPNQVTIWNVGCVNCASFQHGVSLFYRRWNVGYTVGWECLFLCSGVSYVFGVPTCVPIGVVQAPWGRWDPKSLVETRRWHGFQDQRACFSVGSAVRDRVVCSAGWY
jgi:hypothetical protein